MSRFSDKLIGYLALAGCTLLCGVMGYHLGWALAEWIFG